MTTRQREACTALAQLVVDNLSLLPDLRPEVAVSWIAARAVEKLKPVLSMPNGYYREYRRKIRAKKQAAGLCKSHACQNKPKPDCLMCTKCLAMHCVQNAKWRAKRKEANAEAHQGD